MIKKIRLLFIPITLTVFIFNGALKSQTVPVTFKVDMSYQIELGKFSPGSEFVDVAGSFNDWGSSLTVLSDTDGDSVYEKTVAGFTVGTVIEFKFRINGVWDGREEFPGFGLNRSYSIKSDSNVILVYYNDEFPQEGPPVADFTVAGSKIFKGGSVRFINNSMGEITNWEWKFEGGIPEISTEKEPLVYYPETGIFDVGLKVSNDSLSDSLYYEDYIIVENRNKNETAWWNDAVFYEIFVRSFYDSDGDGIGDIRGIIQKLDYLNDGDPNTTEDLGITGIWLMPIHETDTYHGYDVIDYYSINPDFGTMSDFKELLEEARKRGIRIIIDFVMNHSSDLHPWFIASANNNPAFRNFYRWENSNPGYLGPWGQQVWHFKNSQYYYGVFWGRMPDLNYNEQALKDSMFAAAEFWLDEIGVDGFRLDAVIYIFEEGTNLKNTESTLQFWGEFNERIKSVNPESFAVAEAWELTEIALKYVSNNRLDFCFDFDLASAILNSVKSSDASRALDQMRNTYNVYPHLQYATFLTNHDQNRAMTVFEGDKGQSKAAASLYLSLPGVPFLYYGEEIGMTGEGDHLNIRRPMQWSAGINAGFSAGTPWFGIGDNYLTNNVAVMENDSSSLLNRYKKLINVRNQEAALRTGDYEPLVASDQAIYSFFRHYEDQSILVLINFGPNDIESFSVTSLSGLVEPGAYSLKNLLDEADSIEVNYADNIIANLDLEGYGAKFYKFKSNVGVGVREKEIAVKDHALGQNYPNPFNPSTNISYQIKNSGYVNLKIYDALGREIETLFSGYQKAGRYSFIFNARDLSAGVYFYRLNVGKEFSETKKALLIK